MGLLIFSPRLEPVRPPVRPMKLVLWSWPFGAGAVGLVLAAAARNAVDVIGGCGKARLLRHESDTFIAD